MDQRVTVFRVTPYSDDIAEYVSSLSGREIYELFDRDDLSAGVLTASLYAVHKLETLSKKPRDTCQLIGHLFDELLFSPSFDNLPLYPTAFVSIRDGLYSGHVYAWVDPANSVTNILGARISSHWPETYYEEQVPILIRAIRDNISSKYIRSIQPPEVISTILRKHGFTMLKNNPGWLADNNTIGDMPLVRSLIFREYDYVSES